MNRVHRVVVTATTALAVLAAPAAAAATPQRPDRTGLQSRLDAVVAAGAVGALAEVRDQHGVWRGTSGVAELGTARAVPAHGRFRAGSITKTFLATVVLQLADRGRLGLDDPVEKWLPGVVPDADRITVRHLLNHTSGLFDYLGTLPFPPDPAFLDIRRRTWTADELIRGPHPRGYLRIGPDLLDYTEMSPSVMGAGGELISTTRDLNRFFAALLGGRLLPEHLLAEMKTQGVEGGRTYGLGLAWQDTTCGIRMYGNDGDALAYQAYSFATEDRRRQVTVALTPNFTGNPDAAVKAFVDKAICG